MAGAEEGLEFSEGLTFEGPKESTLLTFCYLVSLCFQKREAAELSSLLPSLLSTPMQFLPLLM